MGRAFTSLPPTKLLHRMMIFHFSFSSSVWSTHLGLVVGGHGVDHEQFTFFALHHHPGQQFERPLIGIEETTAMALSSGIVNAVLAHDGVQGAILAPLVDAKQRLQLRHPDSLLFQSPFIFCWRLIAGFTIQKSSVYG